MRYKGALKILSSELFYGLPVLFSRRTNKDPEVMLHKIRGKKGPSRHVYKRFYFQPAGHGSYRVK